ncbi:hypothetical protein B296_00001646 [Ensete ventricosum]|uniref:Uncharacterized protein n=1 Tax=Ensete ventricosum TaxID=4639 RepID=A0A426ZYX3_ENSVE|nr:hypothetical protein B296_00001646 [Ensete ventricosum]
MAGAAPVTPVPVAFRELRALLVIAREDAEGTVGKSSPVDPTYGEVNGFTITGIASLKIKSCRLPYGILLVHDCWSFTTGSHLYPIRMHTHYSTCHCYCLQLLPSPWER